MDNIDIQEVKLILMAGSDENPITIAMVQMDDIGHVAMQANKDFKPLVDHIFGEVLPRLVKKNKIIVPAGVSLNAN